MAKLEKVFCINCKRPVYRSKRRVNENLKLGHNFYCSKDCLSKYRTKKQVLFCENCGKQFSRSPSNISPHNYCSKSCAAKVNNKKHPKKQTKLRMCVICNKKFKGDKKKKYCSKQCKSTALRRYTTQQLIEIIKRAEQKLKRVPAQRELKEIASACRCYFGSWNNAIIAAGLQPNRSHNQRMYRCSNTRALDGHLCDSISEAIIDDWFTKNNIVHKRNMPYPETNHKADWVISIGEQKIFVEYFGLANDSPRYDRAIRKKKMLCRKHKLTLIGIYPQDLYPEKSLDDKLKGELRALTNIISGCPDLHRN